MMDGIGSYYWESGTRFLRISISFAEAVVDGMISFAKGNPFRTGLILPDPESEHLDIQQPFRPMTLARSRCHRSPSYGVLVFASTTTYNQYIITSPVRCPAIVVRRVPFESLGNTQTAKTPGHSDGHQAVSSAPNLGWDAVWFH